MSGTTTPCSGPAQYAGLLRRGGVRGRAGNTAAFGAQMTIGLDYIFKKEPFDISLRQDLRSRSYDRPSISTAVWAPGFTCLDQAYKLPKGLVQVYTATARARPRPLWDWALRAMGHGLRVYSPVPETARYFSGELGALRKSGPSAAWCAATWNTPCSTHVPGDRDKWEAGILRITTRGRRGERRGRYDLVILDEINNCMHKGWCPYLRCVASSKQSRQVEVVLTAVTRRYRSFAPPTWSPGWRWSSIPFKKGDTPGRDRCTSAVKTRNPITNLILLLLLFTCYFCLPTAKPGRCPHLTTWVGP